MLLDHFCLLSLSFLDFDLTNFTMSALVNQRATPLVYPTAGGHSLNTCAHGLAGVSWFRVVSWSCWMKRACGEIEGCAVYRMQCVQCVQCGGVGPTQRRHQPEPVIDCTDTQRHAHPTQPPASLLVRPHAARPDADLPRTAVYVLCCHWIPL